MEAQQGRLIEFQYLDGVEEISSMLADLEEGDVYSVDDAAREILLKAKRRHGGAKVILTTPAQLGFKEDHVDNRSVIEAGLAQGYRLCLHEAAIHLRKLISQRRYESPVIVATEGDFADNAIFEESTLLLLSLDRETNDDFDPPEVIHTIDVVPLAYGQDDQEGQASKLVRSSELHQMWAFEVAQ